MSVWARRESGVALGIAVVVSLGSRLPFAPTYLFSWDSVNFALAMDEWNLAQHQPHPPGYFAYVAFARAVHTLVGDHNSALQLVSTVAAGLAAWLCWRLARQTGVHSTHAAAGSLLLLSSPLVWLYSSVAEVYALDMLSTLIIMSTLHPGTPRERSGELKIAAAFAFAAMVRLPTAVLLLPALLVPPRGEKPRARRVIAGMGGVLGIIVVAAFLDAAFLRAGLEQFASATSDSRVIEGSGQLLEAINRNARDVLRASVMAGVGILALLSYAMWQARRLRVNLSGTLAAAWAVPMLSVFVAVHFGKPGYLLPLIPLACLYVAAGLSVHGRRGVGLLGLATALQVLQFLLATPLGAEVTGGTKRHANKTLSEKLATELSPMTFASRETLRQSDHDLQAFRGVVESHCPGDGDGDGGVVVVGAGASVDWRRTMYYLPGDLVVRYEHAEVLQAAAHHQMRIITSSEDVQSACAPLWSGETLPAGIQAVPAADTSALWIMTMPATINFASDKRLTIHP